MDSARHVIIRTVNPTSLSQYTAYDVASTIQTLDPGVN
jgi:hypothetical protein